MWADIEEAFGGGHSQAFAGVSERQEEAFEEGW